MLNSSQSEIRETSTLPATTRLGYVHLTVNNLDRQIQFYTRVLNFQLHWRNGAEAALGTPDEVLLRLNEDPVARWVKNSTGMYHFAILYPSRKELARAIARLLALDYLNYPTDHGVSKTTYLDDAEENNIELYIRSLNDADYETVNGQLVVRYADGRLGSGRDPLDVEALLREVDASDRLDLPLPAGTRIGHMHLYASSLESSLNFYSTLLGFGEGLMVKNFRMGDVGLDDRQPHVIAFNTWKGIGAPPSPPGALGLRYFAVVLDDKAALQRVFERLQAAGAPIEQTPDGFLARDPSHISLLLTDHMPSPHL